MGCGYYSYYYSVPGLLVSIVRYILVATRKPGLRPGSSSSFIESNSQRLKKLYKVNRETQTQKNNKYTGKKNNYEV